MRNSRAKKFLFVSLVFTSTCWGTTLPTGFHQDLVVSGLADPATMAFSPDGRLFIAERILGRLRVAKPDGDSWVLNSTPFYSFDIPVDGGGEPERHRSSGLRGFAFDPDFANNGYVYCFYMKHQPRHNRIVRIQASAKNPDVADPGETLLLEVPFNGSESSGSHNGGALIFGTDGLLYITTGDGWNGGDNVQSLTTYTGKVFRIHGDGSIPTDNPFYADAIGNLRAIYALGLRNPFSMSRHPDSGQIYINDVAGSNKATIVLLQSGGNYGHDGYDGIGDEVGEWGNAGTGGLNGRVISGGAWYPSCGAFPAEYFGSYFTPLWGGNGTGAGEISRLLSESDPSLAVFATDILFDDPIEDLKPMYTAIGPSGDLYFLASSYEASNGSVYRIAPDIPGAPCEAGIVPAASGWGLMAMLLLLVICATVAFRKAMPGAV